MKKIYWLLVILLIIGGILIFLYYKNNKDEDFASASDIPVSLEENIDFASIDWSNFQEEDINLNDTLTITSEGVYKVMGNIENGSLIIDTKGVVKLILDNVTINNNSGPAVIIENAKLCYIELVGVNTLSDETTYSSNYLDYDGVLFSKDDLVIGGDGTLLVNSNYQDGIVSKDNLQILNGTYIISTSDDGLRGKDSLIIDDGNFTITSLGDAIKTTNDTDSNLGYILIKNGTFDINSESDAISSQTKLKIENGDFNILTCGGSGNKSSSTTNFGFWGTKSSNDESAKGIKALDNLVISGGNYVINSADDAIHSNNYIGILNGNFTISSGDDGIHADSEIIIDNGSIDIQDSYEGIEAANITINDGNIKVVSLDDGINIAGGADSSSQNRKGANNFNSSSSNKLVINGGSIYVLASGDGIDLNGSGYMYDGEVFVDGPTDSANGALDYDGEFQVNGGLFIASGSSGMLQNISSNSTQVNVSIIFNSSYNDKEVEITDSNNNVLVTYKPSKTFSSLIVSSSKLNKNTTYKINVDNVLYTEFTTNSITNTVGSMGNQNMRR